MAGVLLAVAHRAAPSCDRFLLATKMVVVLAEPMKTHKSTSTMLPGAPQLYTPAQAAQYLTIGLNTLWRLKAAGKIGFIQISKRVIRFSPEQLAACLAALQHPPTVPPAPASPPSGPLRPPLHRSVQCTSS